MEGEESGELCDVGSKATYLQQQHVARNPLNRNYAKTVQPHSPCEFARTQYLSWLAISPFLEIVCLGGGGRDCYLDEYFEFRSVFDAVVEYLDRVGVLIDICNVQFENRNLN